MKLQRQPTLRTCKWDPTCPIAFNVTKQRYVYFMTNLRVFVANNRVVAYFTMPSVITLPVCVLRKRIGPMFLLTVSVQNYEASIMIHSISTTEGAPSNAIWDLAFYGKERLLRTHSHWRMIHCLWCLAYDTLLGRRFTPRWCNTQSSNPITVVMVKHVKQAILFHDRTFVSFALFSCSFSLAQFPPRMPLYGTSPASLYTEWSAPTTKALI